MELEELDADVVDVDQELAQLGELDVRHVELELYDESADFVIAISLLQCCFVLSEEDTYKINISNIDCMK